MAQTICKHLYLTTAGSVCCSAKNKRWIRYAYQKSCKKHKQDVADNEKTLTNACKFVIDFKFI